MVLDGLRGYLQLANGLTEVTRERARAAARSLVAQGEAGVGSVLPTPVRAQVSALTEDLLATSKANRDLLVHLVRAEVERSVSRLGLVSAQELHAADQRAARLERQLAELQQQVTTAGRRSTTKKAGTKKAATRKASPTRAASKKSAAPKASTKKSAARRTAGGASR